MKHLVTFSAVLLGCSTLLTGAQAHAWGDLGHSIVGAVAEETMEPKTKDYLRGIMGVEPLEVSAVFPDHVRDDDRFGHKDADPLKRGADNHDFGDYHFCEIPTGQTYDTRVVKPAKDCLGAIQGSINVLNDVKAPREEKQLAIRYLAHVLGDITQPLHVGNGFDLGGNACQINIQESPDRNVGHSNLHSFWDDAMVSFLGTTYADPTQKIGAAKYLNQYVSAFRRLHPELLTPQSKAKFAAGDTKAWLIEAQAIRESGVYPDAPGSMSGVAKGEEAKNRPYCLWYSDQTTSTVGAGSVVDKTKIPTIDRAYELKWAPTVELQLIKGGLRLAAVLDQVAAAQPGAAKMTDAGQEKVLSDIQNAFRAK